MLLFRTYKKCVIFVNISECSYNIKNKDLRERCVTKNQFFFPEKTFYNYFINFSKHEIKKHFVSSSYVY